MVLGRKRLAVLLCLLGAVFAYADSSLRVATYNVRNYLTMERLVEGQYREDYPKPEKEKAVVRESIRLANADVLALQEIGTLGMLLELRDDLAREGLRYVGYAMVEGSDPTRHVAALWKESVEVQVERHSRLNYRQFGEERQVLRGMLELKVSGVVEESPVSIFILHLKSKYTNDSRDPKSNRRRTLEAEAARDRILELYPDPSTSPFLVVGDLNDGPNSSAVRRFLSRGDLEITRLVDYTDKRGLVWTHFYLKNAEYSMVDYILASPGIENAGLEIKAEILDLPHFYDGSDHRLVWADLSF